MQGHIFKSQEARRQKRRYEKKGDFFLIAPDGQPYQREKVTSEGDGKSQNGP